MRTLGAPEEDHLNTIVLASAAAFNQKLGEMKRKDFLKAAGLGIISIPIMSSLSKLEKATASLSNTQRMPVLFLGHGYTVYFQ